MTYAEKIFRGSDHSTGIGLGGRIIFKMDLTDKAWEDVNWINLARNGEQWCHLVKTVIEGHIP